MLVLTRKLQEKIQIGQDITITILRVTGRSVRIGIEAPKGVRVMRAEIPMNEFDGEVASEPAATVQQPIVAEAATCMAEDDEHHDLDTSDAAEPKMEAPLSLHIVRRIRIISPNDNKTSIAKSVAHSVNRIAAIVGH